MANNILSTVELIAKANEILTKHSANLDQATASLNQYINSAKLPSDFVKGVKSIDQAQKDIIKTTKELERTEKKMQRQRISDLKLQKKREVAFDKYERQLDREQRLLEKTTGLYNKVQRGVNQVTKQYQDLAIRKELNGKLSAEETVQLGQLEAKLVKYQNALKQTDANIGKHQRNVGNYKSGFDGLGFSIAQLSREMPAFANSMQTGFMAISNNIPMLVDEINKLKIANKGLVESGKPTVSIFKSLGKAIFGWQTLISIGVTLLTVYGAKLFEWAFGMTEAEKATAEATEELKKQNEELKKNIRLREQQIKSIRDFLDDPELNAAFRGALMDEDSERANLALIELADRLQKIGAKNAESLKDQELSTRDRLNIAGNLLEIEELQGKLQAERVRLEKSQGNQSLKETLRLQGRIKQLEEVNNSLISRKIELTKESTKSQKEYNKEVEDTFGILQGTIPYYEEIIKGLKEQQTQLSRTSQEWFAYQRQIDEFTDSLEALERQLKNTYTAMEGTPKAEEMIDKLVASASLTSSQGADAEDNWKQTFQTITDVARRAFGIIDQIVSSSFQRQFDQLEAQKENAILFAGESATARANIEEQYERKKAAIQKKEARTKKQMAIFDITVDTASAVVRALPDIVLASIVGALGLAQLAMVASQPIPQFWQGGEVGGMQDIMVNDDPYGKKGSNYKEVIEKPNGQLLTPQGKNVKMRVPKGSFVHSTYDAFINSLDSELLGNNIMPVGASSIMPMIINQGLTKGEVMDVMHNQTSRVVDTINKQHGININIDENGINKYIKKKGGISKVMNARYSGRGVSV